ncbi:amidase [Candidimonas nitroreducens]|uniref:amidase n=1 Tax=Candidimonas nitroreducens TaxID=683354 RepID=UPI001303E234|nr:amidase [Candidimonas nitroreducens]
MSLPFSLFDQLGIKEFGRKLRRREITALGVTQAYLDRIHDLDDKLRSFVHVMGEQALRCARAMDELLAAGTDLGPLMGIPVAVKDLFTVTGAPVTAGSRVDISGLVEPEGSFITRLKRAGCVILGKTVTTEFALGLYNPTHRTPWNPCDARIARMPGGSSSGSAVAMAARLGAFTVGTDTGGSVRNPAALCGVFGYKASPGLWPADGIFPLSPTLDSIGFFAASARDAACVFEGIAARTVPPPRPLKGLRFGCPKTYFFDDLDDDVARACVWAVRKLEDAGAQSVACDLDEAREISTVFAELVPAELVAAVGKRRLLENEQKIDPVAWARVMHGVDLSAVKYQAMLKRHRELGTVIKARLQGLDAWLAPTVPFVAPPVSNFTTVDEIAALNRRAMRNAQPVNLFGQCAVSVPIPGVPLPVGLQLAAPAGQDAALLSLAQSVERVLSCH